MPHFVLFLCLLKQKRELNNLLVRKGHTLPIKNSTDSISRMFNSDTIAHGYGPQVKNPMTEFS